MPSLRRSLLTLAATAALAGTAAAPASAIVGGRDATAGQYPAVASVTLGGLFSCTGTLIAPTWVLTAGHCGSLTGAAVSSPISWPAPLIDVRLNSITAHNGDGDAVTVKQAVIPPEYLGFENGYDITLLELSAPYTGAAPVPISGPLQTSLWAPGTIETIVGFGVTEEGGSSPDVLQVAEVPTISDSDCAVKESAFDATTMLCAGLAAGGVDTCQGDSGGPIFGHTGSGDLRVVGATSFGTGCARPDVPGVYARVGDATLRAFVSQYAPQAIDNGPAAAPAPAPVATTTSTKAATKKKAAKKKAAKKKRRKAKAAKRR